jgi:hypothetical protein
MVKTFALRRNTMARTEKGPIRRKYETDGPKTPY